MASMFNSVLYLANSCVLHKTTATEIRSIRSELQFDGKNKQRPVC